MKYFKIIALTTALLASISASYASANEHSIKVANNGDIIIGAPPKHTTATKDDIYVLDGMLIISNELANEYGIEADTDSESESYAVEVYDDVYGDV